MTTKTDIIRDYCRKFPSHGNLTIAKAVYKAYPDLWATLEATRSNVRIVRGACGKINLKLMRDKTLVQPLRKAGAPRLSLPDSEADSWAPYELQSSRTLVLSDIHLPYHDKEALTLALEDGRKAKPDGVLLNGDICDFFAVSRWDRDPRKVNLKREIDRTKEFLAYIRSLFPKATIVWKEGNHEERWAHYLWNKAPELLGVEAFDLSTIFGLDELRIELVGDKRIVKAGLLPILHGHEFPKGLTNPVNQARGMFLRGVECAIAGHGHRTSEHAETSMLGKLITCWSTGCLCDLYPQYMPLNKWNHGFALVETGKGGEFEVDNKRIYKGRVW
jgi:predicted phosphodiesterase